VACASISNFTIPPANKTPLMRETLGIRLSPDDKVMQCSPRLAAKNRHCFGEIGLINTFRDHPRRKSSSFGCRTISADCSYHANFHLRGSPNAVVGELRAMPKRRKKFVFGTRTALFD
jgi:hypothetical protein